MSPDDFEAGVIRYADSYRASEYSVWGPNSNSAAAYPLIMLGATLPQVQEGWYYGAQALHYYENHVCTTCGQ